MQGKAAAGKTAGWDDPETRLFLHALHAYGRSAGLDGGWDIALARVRESLKVDPDDHLGAAELALEVGLPSPVDAAVGLAMRM